MLGGPAIVGLSTFALALLLLAPPLLRVLILPLLLFVFTVGGRGCGVLLKWAGLLALLGFEW